MDAAVSRDLARGAAKIFQVDELGANAVSVGDERPGCADVLGRPIAASA